MHLAMKEHVRLGTDLTKRIDIFDVMERRRLWVMFEPLDALYGAYTYEDNVHGILLNSKHPPNLQRFTAAHEYGHFIMEHGMHWDGEEQILSSRQSTHPQEVEAQTFAAYFLMPLQLVNAALNRMGLLSKSEVMTAQEIYQLSLELGVSYVAVVNRLVTLKKLRSEIARELRSKAPRAIKAEIGGGQSPQNSWADVWTFYKRDSKREVSVYVNDELHIYLPVAHAEDSIWQMDGMMNDASVVVVNADLQIASSRTLKNIDEAAYLCHFFLRAHAPGQAVLQLAKRDAQPASFELSLNVLPRPVQGLAEAQKCWLLDT
jgi:Zn-dependent peptidase ImmA (M78 family)